MKLKVRLYRAVTVISMLLALAALTGVFVVGLGVFPVSQGTRSWVGVGLMLVCIGMLYATVVSYVNCLRMQHRMFFPERYQTD
jgi:hypothetical protein